MLKSVSTTSLTNIETYSVVLDSLLADLPDLRESKQGFNYGSMPY